ncbi:GNAT family N-acetyltransferase [uncultured Oscillibacter sp.]|uniref:GNAT family N-acetyltransferase n=1 Tax=uncultured Oscillibacter sp. TaxID=876091 RepID=UPI0026013706|nr:N-acetyltransferase [uncultured Oscillibacter sp.]
MLVIRKEEAKDHGAVYALIKAAFSQAEHSDGTEQDLVDALRAGDAFIPDLSLVAEMDGKIVGHILFTAASVGDVPVLALAPLAVLPGYQGKGIGTALIEEGHKIAAGSGHAYSVVLGDGGYYSRAGYLPADRSGIKPPFDVPRENFMARKLKENAPSLHGVMRYAKEFGIG